jgi:3-hydroxy acid dehydrogenase/malonic semialdehyde reductase
MSSLQNKIVLITGASAGIGLATAEAFAEAGAALVLGARRLDKLKSLATSLKEKHNVAILPMALDVTDEKSCETFIHTALEKFSQIDVLVNNAGLARGTSPVATQAETDVREMFETNVFALMRLTRLALVPMLEKESGHIINLGSVAGHGVYEGGSAYCSTKHAVRVISEGLRLELLGKKIRVSSVDPGLVETEFSLVRFSGDAEKASKVYQGYTPLSPRDVADCIVFAASRPLHVNVDEIIVRPLDQAGFKVNRS